MGEAGQSVDTPLTMAPPSRGDSDDEAPTTTLPVTGVMAPPPAEPEQQSGNANGKSKATKPRLDTDADGDSVSDSDENPGSASVAPKPAVTVSKPDASEKPGADQKPGAGAEPADTPSAPAFPADDLRPRTRVPTGQGKTEGTSAGEAVKQVVAATGNWFASQAAKVAGGSASATGAASGGAPASGSTSGSAGASASAPASTTIPPAYTPPWRATRPAGSATPGSATPGSAATPGKQQRRSKRQAHLSVARIDPVSVMKFSGVVSVIAFVVLFVAVAVLYAVLSSFGVFTSLQHLVSTVTSSQSSGGTNITGWFSSTRILEYTAILGGMNVVLITAMATIGAVVYNLISTVVGGIEVTLRETE